MILAQKLAELASSKAPELWANCRSRNLLVPKRKIKMHPRGTYAEVLERLREDLRELNQHTKRAIEEARWELGEGKFRTHEELRADIGF